MNEWMDGIVMCFYVGCFVIDWYYLLIILSDNIIWNINHVCMCVCVYVCWLNCLFCRLLLAFGNAKTSALWKHSSSQHTTWLPARYIIVNSSIYKLDQWYFSAILVLFHCIRSVKLPTVLASLLRYAMRYFVVLFYVLFYCDIGGSCIITSSFKTHITRIW